jgi:hypothetical protein
LGTSGSHFFANDLLDLGFDHQTKREPAENTRCRTPYVTRANKQPMAFNLSVGWVFSKGS